MKINIKKHKNLGLMLAIWIAVIIVYHPALRTFFVQDDFTHLMISQADGIGDWLRFWLPTTVGIFYRPLSIQIYTWFSRLIFGLNPFGYHLIALGFHLTNSYIVIKLVQKLTRSRNLSYLGGLFYGVSGAHFMSLFWIAEFSMVLAPFFAFLSLYRFFEKKYWSSLAFLILGLISNELVVAVPVVLAVWALIYNKEGYRKLFFHFGAVGLFAIFRLVVSPLISGSDYKLVFSLSTFVTNLRWQVFRALGLPEGFWAYTGLLYVKMALGFFVAMVTFWMLMTLKSLRGSGFGRKKWKLAGFGLLWFVASLLPVIFLSQHQSPIYMLIGLPGFYLAQVSPFVGQKSNELAVIAASAAIFGLGFWSVRSQAEYHWVTKRAKLAEYHIEKLSSHKERLGSINKVMFLDTESGSAKEVYISLAGENGVKSFFGNKVEVVFGDESPVDSEGVYVFGRNDL